MDLMENATLVFVVGIASETVLSLLVLYLIVWWRKRHYARLLEELQAVKLGHLAPGKYNRSTENLLFDPSFKSDKTASFFKRAVPSLVGQSSLSRTGTDFSSQTHTLVPSMKEMSFPLYKKCGEDEYEIERDEKDPTKEKVLAQGGGGKIHPARLVLDTMILGMAMSRDQNTDKRLVVKRIQKGSAAVETAFREEVALMTYLKEKTPYVATVYGFNETEAYFEILMKYYSLDSLKNFMEGCRDLDKGNPALLASYIVNFSKDIANALKAMHSIGYIHSDLKPHNVLIERAESFGNRCIACLTDFGISHQVEQVLPKVAGKSDNFIVGASWRYASPELLRQLVNRERMSKDVALASDVYSYGMVLYFLLTQKQPWDHVDVTDRDVRQITLEKANEHEYLKLSPKAQERIKSNNQLRTLAVLMTECWQYNYALRPTMLQISARLSAIDYFLDT